MDTEAQNLANALFPFAALANLMECDDDTDRSEVFYSWNGSDRCAITRGELAAAKLAYEHAVTTGRVAAKE